MAWGSVATLGSTQSKAANQATLVLTTSAALEAGNVGVIIIAKDNDAGTDDTDGNEVTSVTDSAGNTWTKALENVYTGGGGGAQAAATCDIWYVKATNELASGGGITVTFAVAANVDAAAATAWEFTAGGTVSIEATNHSVSDADPPSLDATTSNAEFLRVRGIAGEGSNLTATMTPTTNWAGFDENGTTGAGGATNISVRGEWRISTGTSDASDPTWAATQHSNVYVAFKEAAAAGGAVATNATVTRINN